MTESIAPAGQSDDSGQGAPQSGTPDFGAPFESLPQGWQNEVARLRNEAAKHRTLYSEVNTKWTEAQPLIEKANQRIAELEDNDGKNAAELALAQAMLGKTHAAVKAGLPADFAERLKGESADEWESDAKTLAETFGTKRSVGYIDPSQGVGSGTATPLNGSDLERGLAGIFGASGE